MLRLAKKKSLDLEVAGPSGLVVLFLTSRFLAIQIWGSVLFNVIFALPCKRFRWDVERSVQSGKLYTSLHLKPQKGTLPQPSLG